MKKILILYAKYGGGHEAAANSIKSYISNNYSEEIQVEYYDCMEYASPFCNFVTTNAYKIFAKNAPFIWKKIYYSSKGGLFDKFSRLFNKIMAMKLYKLFKQISPDIVISTHPFASQITSYLKKKGYINCELATILTDFAAHDQWLVGKDFGDYFFVSNEKMKQTMINQYKISESKIYVTGIPLADKFSNISIDNTIYEKYNLKKDKKTILFFAGGGLGLGQKRTLNILNTLLKHLDKYQIIAISGKNKKMYNSFIHLSEQINNEDLHVLEYTHDVPDLMHISSIVVTKPGGLTSSESLASHLPILIINPIPGQEEENAEFLENSEAAIWLKKKDNIDMVISNILNDTDTLQKMKNNTVLIAKPQSTKDICETLFSNL